MPKVQAAGTQCQGSSGSNFVFPKVGGVALDQAATFLANMDDITGAYYDAAEDRIVFIGKENTSLPEFNKDDLAVAIRAVLFNKVLPAVSIETDIENPAVSNVYYYGGIENTEFGKVLVDADYKMKLYEFGFDENQQQVTSSVSGYLSVFQRFLDKDPPPTASGSSRFVLRPDLVSLKRDTTAKSFVFDQVTMEVYTEPLSPYNDYRLNDAAAEFAQHHTQHFDEFAQETSAYADAKQLGKIVAVIKWLADNNIPTDFNWAWDYTPKIVETPEQYDTVYTPEVEGWVMHGGTEYYTPNTYGTDDGTSSALKSASEAIDAPKEEIHWSFTHNGENFESVAVAADAFRSLGAYSTSVTDMSFPTSGDLSLSFSRAYSSFSGGQSGIGRGWSYAPATLVDNKPKSNGHTSAYCDGETYLKRYSLAFGLNGFRESFYYDGINETECGYIPEENVFHSSIVPERISSVRTQYHITTRDQITYTFEDLVNIPLLTEYQFRLISVADKTGSRINYNYESSTSARLSNISDDNGHEITIHYNTDDLITSIEDWENRTVNYTYDDQGNLLTVTDPEENVTTYSYDSNNKLISIEDREDNTVVTNTYTPEAKLATQTNAANITKTFSYDTDNRIVIATDSATPSRTTSVKYDEKARILEDIDPLSNKFVYTYGTEYAPLTITDKNNNTITNTYDSNGNITSVTDPYEKEIEYEYNAKNFVTKVTDNRYGGIPKESLFGYDSLGNLLYATESGRTTRFTYNTDGELLTKTDPLNHTITWTRDTFGNKLTEKDHLDNTTTYTYDTLARLIEQEDPDEKIISFTYDDNGNILSRTDGSRETSYQYDKENRLKKTIFPNT